MASITVLNAPSSTTIPFLTSALRKAFAPLTTTSTSTTILEATSKVASTLGRMIRMEQQRLLPQLRLFSSNVSSQMVARRCSRRTATSSFSFWRSMSTTMTVACLSFVVLSVMIPISSFTVDAAPAKHTPAPANLVKGMSMAYSPSDTSDRLPLQLQIEAQVAGKQQLAYLPTGGPSLDFYYLNYRPAYRAGESTIDFWMLTPKGSKAPKTGSLELYDEFGRIRLAVLVPEGTEIPQALANKNEPFLWKSWPVPKTLKADFDFSEKFRVVLRTSDSKTAQAVAEANVNVNANGINKTVKKRLDDLFGLLANPNKNQQGSATSSRVVAQDRQFRIKGLTASPGGQPHPAKLHVNSVAPATVSGAKSGTPFVPSSGGSLNTSSGNSNANSNSIGHDAPLPSNSNDKDKSSTSSSSSSSTLHRRPFLLTLAVMVVATILPC